MINNLEVIAFDADDTLWNNEPFYQAAEHEFCSLLENYLPQHSVSKELFSTEMQNLHLYGYGVKGFALSMIETAIRITDQSISPTLISKIIDIAKKLLQEPIELLDGVEETLKTLQGKYRLVVATKGDLVDQERKLKSSGLSKYFHHIEIMSDKKESDYEKLLKHLDCKAENFLMIGNSVKSDIIPVLNLGGYGVYIPYHVTWSHEQHETKLELEKFIELETIDKILNHLMI